MWKCINGIGLGLGVRVRVRVMIRVTRQIKCLIVLDPGDIPYLK